MQATDDDFTTLMNTLANGPEAASKQAMIKDYKSLLLRLLREKKSLHAANVRNTLFCLDDSPFSDAAAKDRNLLADELDEQNADLLREIASLDDEISHISEKKNGCKSIDNLEHR